MSYSAYHVSCWEKRQMIRSYVALERRFRDCAQTAGEKRSLARFLWTSGILHHKSDGQAFILSRALEKSGFRTYTYPMNDGLTKGALLRRTEIEEADQKAWSWDTILTARLPSNSLTFSGVNTRFNWSHETCKFYLYSRPYCHPNCQYRYLHVWISKSIATSRVREVSANKVRFRSANPFLRPLLFTW